MIIGYIAITSANKVPVFHCPFYEAGNSYPQNEIFKCIILSTSTFFFSFKHHVCYEVC